MAMELDTLDGTSWDVLIAGTGLHESLLALALSRSGKKILHVDKHDYYGSSIAALSLQDAQEWAEQHSSQDSLHFTKALTTEPSIEPSNPSVQSVQLGFSRAYSLALAPQIIYAHSALLPSLVSSKVDSQLEFVAVGSCFVFNASPQDGGNTSGSQEGIIGSLVRVPSSREDIFADESLESKHKRGLMKFIKFIVDFEDQAELWENNQSTPFDEFLSKNFNLSPSVQQPLQALTLSLNMPHDTEIKFAIPRIARHLRSIGVFGPGFGSVLPKWGGLAEIAQVGCRACAVGGGIYMLGNGIESIESLETANSDSESRTDTTSSDVNKWRVKLKKGETISATWLTGGYDNLSPLHSTSLNSSQKIHPRETNTASRVIAIVSSPLEPLFSQVVEGSPLPAVAIVQFPDSKMISGSSDGKSLPIHLMIHSSETGECPTGQCVIYGSVACKAEPGYSLLEQAVQSLLKTACSGDERKPQVLWQLQFEQHSRDITSSISHQSDDNSKNQNVMIFPQPGLDLAYDDQVLRDVRKAWQSIMGSEAVDFMTFAAREDLGTEGEEDNDDGNDH